MSGRPTKEEADAIERETRKAWGCAKAGKSVKEVAEGLGLTRNALIRRFQSRGWNVSAARRKCLQGAYKSFQAGESLESLAHRRKTTVSKLKTQFHRHFGHQFPIGRPKQTKEIK